MSSDTSRSVIVAGWILVVLGSVHLVLAMVFMSGYLPDWLAGDLWSVSDNNFAEPSPVFGAFWLSIGSFGVPLALLGGLLVAMGRRGQAPPLFVGVGVVVWFLVFAAIFEPSPAVVGLIPGVMLIRARARG